MMRRISTAVCSAWLLGASSSWAQSPPPDAAAPDDAWHFAVAPYFWMAGLDGEISVRGAPEVSVDASFSDILENFDFGLLGHFEARRNRWGFGTDLIYLNLGAAVAEDRPVLGLLDLDADVRQTVLEGFGFYRFATWKSGQGRPGSADVLVGTRYTGISTELQGTGVPDNKRTFSYVDGMAGLRVHVPLGARAGVLARVDLASFGSDLTLNTHLDVSFKLSTRWYLAAGYRFMNIDYDKGTGVDRKLYDVSMKGPIVGALYAW